MGEDSEEAKGRGEKPLSGDSEGLAGRELGERRARRPRGSEAAALEASARVLPVQRHRKTLQEHDGAGVCSLELACSQSRRFGKLGPDTSGCFAPASTHRLDDHGGECDALG